MLSEELKEMGSEAQNRIVAEKRSNLPEWVSEEVGRGRQLEINVSPVNAKCIRFMTWFIGSGVGVTGFRRRTRIGWRCS